MYFNIAVLSLTNATTEVLHDIVAKSYKILLFPFSFLCNVAHSGLNGAYHLKQPPPPPSQVAVQLKGNMFPLSENSLTFEQFLKAKLLKTNTVFQQKDRKGD